MRFGEIIEKARRKRGLSKSKLAGKSDLSVATISRIEKSERSLSLETIDKAADELGLQAIIKLIPKPQADEAAVNL